MRLINADAAIEAVVGCTNCGNEDELRAYVTKHSLENGWTGGIVDALDAIEELLSAQPDTTTHDSIPAETGKNDKDRTSGDCISRRTAIDAICEDGTWLERQGRVDITMAERKQRDVDIISNLPSVQPDLGKYEYHYDHTDCIWYRPEARNRCPVTCAQYRDGWNDAMNYIFRDGKGYMPYRRDKQYGE